MKEGLKGSLPFRSDIENFCGMTSQSLFVHQCTGINKTVRLTLIMIEGKVRDPTRLNLVVDIPVKLLFPSFTVPFFLPGLGLDGVSGKVLPRFGKGPAGGSPGPCEWEVGWGGGDPYKIPRGVVSQVLFNGDHGLCLFRKRIRVTSGRMVSGVKDDVLTVERMFRLLPVKVKENTFGMRVDIPTRDRDTGVVILTFCQGVTIDRVSELDI